MTVRSLVLACLFVTTTACGGAVEGPDGVSSETPAATLSVERDGVVQEGFTCATEDTQAITGHGAVFLETKCRNASRDLTLILHVNEPRVGTWAGAEAGRVLGVELGEGRGRATFEPGSTLAFDKVDKESRVVTGNVDVRFTHIGTKVRVRGPLSLSYPVPK